MSARGSYFLNGSTVGFFPATLAADLPKGDLAVINANVVVNLANDYIAGTAAPHLTVVHNGLEVDAAAGITYNAGDLIYVTTAAPNDPANKTSGAGRSFVGWCLRGKSIPAGPAGTIEIMFDGRAPRV